MAHTWAVEENWKNKGWHIYKIYVTRKFARDISVTLNSPKSSLYKYRIRKYVRVEK